MVKEFQQVDQGFIKFLVLIYFNDICLDAGLVLTVKTHGHIVGPGKNLSSSISILCPCEKSQNLGPFYSWINSHKKVPAQSIFRVKDCANKSEAF